MSKTNPIYVALAPRGFETAGALCFGIWNGYVVQLRPYSGANYYLDVAVRVDKKDKALRKGIQKSVKENYGKNLGCINNGQFLSFAVRFQKKTPYEEQFAAYMSAILPALREHGVRPADSCAICGGGTPDSLCLSGGCYQPVHSGCIHNLATQAQDAVEQNKVNGSYLTGFVGALLGMLVGTLPNIFTIVSMEYIYAVLFALVPMASAWGYRKFKGKMDKLAIVIVVLLSFVSIFIMQYLVLAITLLDEYSLTVGDALWFASDLLFTADGLALIVSESGSLFLFMLLGLFFAWRYIGQTNASSIKQLDTLMSTLRPNPACAPDGCANESQQTESDP